MEYYIIIPAHNEEVFLEHMLNSIITQTVLPKRVIVVNDNSTDATEAIIDSFVERSAIFKKLNRISSSEHLPGSKVVTAFNKGFELLDDAFDIIVKLDADIILPNNYFEVLIGHFKTDPKIGICGGFIYEQTASGNWELNHPMDSDHIRGAFKAYSKACFKAIGGLKTAMGWDTVDELLARYHGFKTFTDPMLRVKHLRPTGKAYNKKSKRLQGKAMYTMRYGFIITCIASVKMAVKNKSFPAFWNNIAGFVAAYKNGTSFIVTKKEGVFIRNLRWYNIKRKLSS